MYTAADYLIDQGVEKGLEQGQHEARVSIAKRMLATGMDVSFICETTELTEQEVRAIQETGIAPRSNEQPR